MSISPPGERELAAIKKMRAAAAEAVQASLSISMALTDILDGLVVLERTCLERKEASLIHDRLIRLRELNNQAELGAFSLRIERITNETYRR